jgi:hypothetical protein
LYYMRNAQFRWILKLDNYDMSVFMFIYVNSVLYL